MGDQSSRARYVGRVREETQRVMREVLAENEKLREIVGTLDRDNEVLHEQLATLTTELDIRKQKEEALRRKLDDIGSESSKLARQVAEIEERSANLANLYVASYQLHGTVNREAVLGAIGEIVINLIGSEQFAVFERRNGGAFRLLTSFGIAASEYESLSEADALGRLIASGETKLYGQPASSDGLPPLVACVPMKIDDEIVGGIVIFALLPHKQELADLDYELFDLLGSHAGTALYCTALHAEMSAGAAS